jgi:hypothetical protein
MWIELPKEIPDLALQANVGDKAAQGVGLEARHVAGVGVAVGIAIGRVEKQCDVVAFSDDGVRFPADDFLVFALFVFDHLPFMELLIESNLVVEFPKILEMVWVAHSSYFG